MVKADGVLRHLSSSALLAASLLGGGQVARAAAPVAASPVPGLTYRLEPVAEGVYCAIAEGLPYYVSNSAVILGPDGVLLVDSGAGTAEALVLREAIRSVTDRPVRYVVDTHFHFDHAFGGAAFPEALIIGHEAAHAPLARWDPLAPTFGGYVSGLPGQAAAARAEAERATDAAKREDLARRAEALDTYHAQVTSLVPVAPQLAFDDHLTLWLGEREVRVLHPGRGHTAGDVVVFLPQERVVCTGDLFNGYIGYMGDAFVDEWADTLGRLAGLDFETVVPGHGRPFRGKEAIAPVQAVLRDLWRQAQDLRRGGIAADAAAERIDLRAHAERFPRLPKPGFEPSAVRRIYAVLDERKTAE